MDRRKSATHLEGWVVGGSVGTENRTLREAENGPNGVPKLHDLSRTLTNPPRATPRRHGNCRLLVPLGRVENAVWRVAVIWHKRLSTCITISLELRVFLRKNAQMEYSFKFRKSCWYFVVALKFNSQYVTIP